ncbi:MAG: alpha/beta hydrolase [Bacteroidota bacterium]
MSTQVIKESITFQAEGLTLAGHLFKPANFDSSQRYPAVVTGGSLTSVKEQMAGTYAQKLAEQGLIALAFDYRNFGESEGQPRQFEDPQLKLEDLKAAVTFLSELPYVQAVGGLGVCTSGGNMAYLAAEDDRVNAVATVASWLPNTATLPLLYGSPDKLQNLQQAGAKAQAKYTATGENTIIPAYHNTDTTASHVGPMEYYMDANRGGGVKEWKNEFAVMSWEPWLAFDPMSKASAITTPFMMFHSDGSALPDNAKQFFAALKGEKQLVWGGGYHFDYYDNEEMIQRVVEQVKDFFKAQLA